MAQTWQAIVGSNTYTVSGGTLSWRLTAHNTGLPPVRRLTQRSPQQHGHTDLGFRYDAREMRLVYLFEVGSNFSADGRRDDLYEIWKALESTPIKLKVTRDDASVYQIDCYVTGVLDMPDDLNDRIGSSQRFVVTVVCPDPMWYDPTQASTTFDEDDNLDWWLALGTIGSGSVEEHVESPTQGQVFGGSDVPDGSSWTIFYRTTAGSSPGSVTYAFDARSTSNWTSSVYYGGASNTGFANGEFASGISISGQADYAFVVDGSYAYLYRDNVLIGTSNAFPRGLDVSNSRWRDYLSGGGAWTPAIPYAAIYNVALSSDQRAALVTAIDSTFSVSKTIAYAGSFSEYPVITIVGPITDPVLTNVSTGEVLDFTGITISGGDSYIIDCRFGYKTVKNAAGTNKIADLTSDSDLATFHLGAAPEVSEGNNAITLSGTSTDANTQVTVAYYNRYVGL